MKRDVTLFKGEGGSVPGDDDAMRAAMALANLADAAVIDRITQILTVFDFVGGQAYLQARREKYDFDGNRIPSDKVDGEWETVAYVIRYDTRDQRMMATTDRPFKEPDDVKVPTPDAEVEPEPAAG